MKVRRIVFIIVLLISYPVMASFLNILKERLEEDTQYLQALKNLKIAQQKIQADRSWFMPYVQLNSRLLWEDGSLALSVSPMMSFDVEGWRISISNTFSPDEANGSWQGWSISIGKNLFEFEDVEDLEELASYLQSVWDVKNSKNRVFRALVEEVFDAWMMHERMKVIRKKLEIHKRILKKKTVNEGVNVSEREIAIEERELLSLKSNIKALEQKLIGAVEVSEELLNEILESVRNVLKNGAYGESWDLREDLEAQKLLLKAAELRKKRTFVEYLPTPMLSFSWLEKPAPSQRSLTVGISLSWSLIDKGERNVQIETTNLEYEILKVKLEKTFEELKNQWMVIEKKRETLDLEKRIKEIDLSLALSDLEKARRKLEMGLITRDELELLEMDVREKELEIREQEFEGILLELDALMLKGLDITGLLGVEE
ncbi:MAG: TolC family protein [Candidatus Syntropharchaeia archaeon]